MTKAQEKVFSERVKAELEKMRDYGIAVGAKAMCKTIEDIVDDNTLHDTEKLVNIKHFCVVALGEDKEKQNELRSKR